MATGQARRSRRVEDQDNAGLDGPRRSGRPERLRPAAFQSRQDRGVRLDCPEGHDAPLIMLVNLVERPIGSGDELGKRRGGNRDLAVRLGWLNENEPASYFDLGRFLCEITLLHSVPLYSLLIRQRRNGTRQRRLIKRLITKVSHPTLAARAIPRRPGQHSDRAPLPRRPILSAPRADC